MRTVSFPEMNIEGLVVPSHHFSGNKWYFPVRTFVLGPFPKSVCCDALNDTLLPSFGFPTKEHISASADAELVSYQLIDFILTLH